MGSELKHLLHLPTFLINVTSERTVREMMTHEAEDTRPFALYAPRWVADFRPWGGMGVWPRAGMVLVETLAKHQGVNVSDLNLIEALALPYEATRLKLKEAMSRLKGINDINSDDGTLDWLLINCLKDEEMLWFQAACHLTARHLHRSMKMEYAWLLIHNCLCTDLEDWAGTVNEAKLSEETLSEIAERRWWRDNRKKGELLKIAAFAGYDLAIEDIQFLKPAKKIQLDEQHNKPTMQDLSDGALLNKIHAMGREVKHLAGLGVVSGMIDAHQASIEEGQEGLRRRKPIKREPKLPPSPPEKLDTQSAKNGKTPEDSKELDRQVAIAPQAVKVLKNCVSVIPDIEAIDARLDEEMGGPKAKPDPVIEVDQAALEAENKARKEQPSAAAIEAFELACTAVKKHRHISEFKKEWFKQLSIAEKKNQVVNECCFKMAVAAVSKKEKDHDNAIRLAFNAVADWTLYRDDIEQFFLNWSLEGIVESGFEEEGAGAIHEEEYRHVDEDDFWEDDEQD